MSTPAPVLADGTEVRISPLTARPLLLGAMAALSAGAAAIHFAVMFEHFSEYSTTAAAQAALAQTRPGQLAP